MSVHLPPQTGDGWFVLHQYFHFNNEYLASLTREQITQSLSRWSTWLEQAGTPSPTGQSGVYGVIGHRGQLLVIHFADSLQGLREREQAVLSGPLARVLTYQFSYLSAVELGMYVVTKKAYESCTAKGLSPGTPEWTEAFNAFVEPHREHLKERLFPAIPTKKFNCFYPMSKRRGEVENWYRQDLARRAELLTEHGMTGRRYSNRVEQIISSSVGYDSWEWSVDLFADDPRAFKELVYEMRFDEVTALYGEFGEFIVSQHLTAVESCTLIEQRWNGCLELRK